MAVEWPVLTIEEIAEKVAMGPFGSSIKVETFVPEGIPIISGQHLHGFRVDDEAGFNFITQEHAERLKNSNVQRGDIVVTHRGNIGQVAYIPEDSKFDRYVISQSQFYMRCDRSKTIPEFVVAYFKTPEGQHKLLANTSQVGVPSIAQPVTYLRTIELPLPPLPEQRAIAHILSTLDDKIELNRWMNETLEAIARAIFKSWFVDFDPVRAKAEGRDPGLPKHLADLFPDSFEDSELGEIPKGWKVKEIRECCSKIQNGGTPKRSESDYWNPGTIPWLTSSEVRQTLITATENMISELGLKRSSAKWVPKDSTVVALYGATAGQVALISSKMTTNQAVCGLIPKAKFRYFNYLSLNRFVGILANLARGSAQQNISKGIVETIKVIIPQVDILESFDHLVSSIFNKWVANLEESKTLAALRDTLLPKLISGELRVPDAEKIIKEANV